MARKRANGQGTINKRKDGRWQAMVTIGHTTSGKQKRKTIYGRTQAEVSRKLTDLQQTMITTDLSIEDMTLDAYLQKWLTEKSRQVKPRTIESYAGTVRRHISPKLGRIKLRQLKPLRVQTALGQIADEVSPHSSNYARSVLLMALNHAIKWQLIPTNPVLAVDRVREEKRDMTIWTTSQIGAFLEHAESHRLYGLFYLAITSGLRIGELLALSWEDLDGNVLRVRQNLTRQQGKWVLATTKTSKGRRVVTLAADTLEVLSAHKQRQEAEVEIVGDSWQRPNHMFTTEIGTYLDQRNVLRTWHRIQAQVGLPRARLHDARHLHVSLLVRHGLDARTIADRVGHTSPAFTLRQYAHLFEEQRQAAAVPLSDLLKVRQDQAAVMSNLEAAA